MVGVPFLRSRCPSGPSMRIGWPSACFDFSHSMTRGPQMKQMTSAVTTAPPPRKV